MENSSQDNKKKQMLILGGLVLLVLIIIIVIVASGKNGATTTTQTGTNTGTQTGTTGTVSTSTVPVPEISKDLPAAVQEVLKTATVEAPGASLVTKDDKVVNDSGVQVKNDAAPMTADAPRLTAPIQVSQLAASAIKLKATTGGFVPKEFTVKAGAAVTLSLTSDGVDSRLVFQDKSLQGDEIPVPMGYTMAKTFNAPAAGKYVFYQDIPGRSGETGTMIVQ
jgi:plastocyanin